MTRSLRDVTDRPGTVEAAGFAAEIAALERQGLVVMARVATGYSDTLFEQMVSNLGEDDAAWMRENRGRPETLLANAERTVIAHVKPYVGGDPWVTLRSWLADGTVAETRSGQLRPTVRAAERAGVDPEDGHCAERSVRSLPVGLDALVRAHEAHLAEHVAARGHLPVPMTVYGYLVAHDALDPEHHMAWLRRQVRYQQRGGLLLRVGVLAMAAGARVLTQDVIGMIVVLALGWPATNQLAQNVLPRPAARAVRADPPGLLGPSTSSPWRWSMLALGVLVAGISVAGLIGRVPVWMPPLFAFAFGVQLRDLYRSLVEPKLPELPADPPPPEIAELGEDARALVHAAQAGRREVVTPERAPLLAPWLPRSELEAWAESGDPRGACALGFAHLRWAWLARGHGMYEDIDPRAMPAFGGHLNAAWAAFQRAASLDPTDPWPHAGAIAVGMPMDRTAVGPAFARACALDPSHRWAHEAMLQCLCAKWFGSDEESLAFARSAPPGLEDLVVQAHLQRMYFSDRPHVFSEPEVAAEVRAAWAVYEARGDDAPGPLNEFAFALARGGDDAGARRALERLGRCVTAAPWAVDGHPQVVVAALRARLGLAAQRTGV